MKSKTTISPSTTQQPSTTTTKQGPYAPDMSYKHQNSESLIDVEAHYQRQRYNFDNTARIPENNTPSPPAAVPELTSVPPIHSTDNHPAVSRPTTNIPSSGLEGLVFLGEIDPAKEVPPEPAQSTQPVQPSQQQSQQPIPSTPVTNNQATASTSQ